MTSLKLNYIFPFARLDLDERLGVASESISAASMFALEFPTE